MKLFISLLLAFFIIGCTNPIASIIERKYPQCVVINMEEDGFERIHVKMQCPGGVIKEVTFNKNERVK